MVQARTHLHDLTVLVVEDDFDSRNVATMILQRHGATVMTACDGLNGLEQVRAHRPDFIVTDIMMPQMDGWTMIEQIRRDPTTADIPIIVLTAHSDGETRARAAALNCDDFILKPIMPRTFVRELADVLGDIPAFAARFAE